MYEPLTTHRLSLSRLAAHCCVLVSVVWRGSFGWFGVRFALWCGAATAKTSNPYMLLENILDTAIVINEKGSIQYFNKRAEAFFGYNRSETLGRNVKMLMPSPFADEHDTYLTNYLTTGQAKVRVLLSLLSSPLASSLCVPRKRR